MDYYIENGARRSVAAREDMMASVLATLHEPGRSDSVILVKLAELHSPKSAISKSDPRYQKVVQAMSSPQARAKLPPIDVQPLGEAGQKSTVPLAQVQLDP